MNLPVPDQLHAATIIIESGKAKSSEGFLLIGSALSLVLREKLWVDSFQNFGEYCTSVGLSRSYAYKFVQAWERWGDSAKGIEPHRLIKLLPLKVENEAEVLEQARELNPGAFNDVVRELKGEPATDNCDHADKVLVCSKCAKRFV